MSRLQSFTVQLYRCKCNTTAALNCYRIIVLIRNYESLIRNYELLFSNYGLLIRNYNSYIRITN